MSHPERGAVADPHAVLQVAPGATMEELREAYLARIKEHPPDRSPVEFERIRDAYQALKDPRARAARMLDPGESPGSLVELADRLSRERCFVGPHPWLAELAGKNR